MRQLRIGLVTAYPPTQGRLSEYGWHLAEQLRINPRVAEVRVLADRCDRADLADPKTLTQAKPPQGCPQAAEGPRREARTTGSRDGPLAVERCWTFDGFDFPVRIARAALRHRLDAMWFNIHLTSTGRRRLPRVCALSTPAAVRLLRCPTIVTLHHLPDLTDLAAAGIAATPLDLAGARTIVRVLGLASAMCVPLPEYAALLRRRYHVRRAQFRPLGVPGLPPVSGIARNPNALLAFGRFGSYKRLEVVLDAVARLHRSGHPVHLHVAGSDSVYSPGYLSSMQRAYAAYPNVTFHGYVPEASVPPLFQQCAAALLPYRTATGASSVAMQAAMYGTAIVAADVPGLHLTSNLGLDMTFLQFDDAGRLAAALEAFLAAPRARDAQIERNLAYCENARMRSVVDGYLDEIEALAGGRYRGRMTVEMTSSVRS